MTTKKHAGHNPEQTQKMWNIMRSLGTFTIVDLMTLAGIKQNFAQRYVYALVSCGYVRKEGIYSSGHKHHYRIYRLVKNTGPLTPGLRMVMFDRNLKEVIGNVD